MIPLELRNDRIVMGVKVHAGARTSQVQGTINGMLKVSVTQVAEKGKANQAVIKLLSDVLKLRRSDIELISGDTSSLKKFAMVGVTRDELTRRIDALLG